MTRRSQILLLLIWTAFLVRGVFYSTFIPMWEGWDEYPHFAVVQHMQLGRPLPAPDEVMSAEISRSLQLVPLGWGIGAPPKDSVTHDEFWLLAPEERAARSEALTAIPRELQGQPGSEYMYEGKQPPLYYWLAGLVLRSVSGTSLVTRAYVTRLFSVLVASTVVFLGFACARRFFGDEGIALQTAALITAMPQLFINISRVSNEPLSILLYSLLAYLLLRTIEGKLVALFFAEVVLALGFLTKAYFVAAVPAMLVVVILALRRERKGRRIVLALRIASVGVLSVGLCAWWYIRSLGSSSGPIWDDAAPVILSLTDMVKALAVMEWRAAADFTLSSHIWLGGWSVMGLRSWINHVFQYGYILGFAGLVIFFVRRPKLFAAGTAGVAAVSILYFGFWMALLYHAFVSFSRQRPPASGGWYLFAAIVPEVLVVLAGLWQLIPAGWRRSVLTVATGAFVILDVYSIHFLSIPYYTGIVRHTADGVLKTFYISDAAALGWWELLARLTVNKPAAISPMVLLALWLIFLAVTLSVPFLPRMAYSRVAHAKEIVRS